MVSCTNLKYSAPYLPCMPSGYSSIPLTSMPTTNKPEGTVLKLIGTIKLKTINVINVIKNKQTNKQKPFLQKTVLVENWLHAAKGQ